MYGFFLERGRAVGRIEIEGVRTVLKGIFSPYVCLLADICDCLCMGYKLDYPALSNSFKVV